MPPDLSLAGHVLSFMTVTVIMSIAAVLIVALEGATALGFAHEMPTGCRPEDACWEEYGEEEVRKDV